MCHGHVDVPFTEDELDRLRIYAASHNSSLGEVVREAVRRHILEPDAAARRQAIDDLTSGRLGLDGPDWPELERAMADEVAREVGPD